MNELQCEYCGKPIQRKVMLNRVFYVYSCDCHEKQRTKQEKQIKIKKFIEKAKFPAEPKDIILGAHPNFKFQHNLVLPSVKEYYNDLNKFKNSKIGLFLLGAPGVGKTISLIWLLIEIIKAYQTPVLFQPAENISRLFLSFNYKDNQDYKYIRNIPVLFLDDIIPQKWNFFELIDYRVNNYKLTFFSTNYSFEEIKEYFGPAVMSRIKSKTIIINVKDKVDKRKLIF